MLMFRSRRSNLIERLCKALVWVDGRRGRERGGERGSDDEVGRRRTTPASLKSLIKTLNEIDLEKLFQSVIGGMKGEAGCVLVQPINPQQPPPHLLSCRAWRWGDLDSELDIRPLPSCSSRPEATCINPHHWSRLCHPDTPPPPYSRFPCERFKPKGDKDMEMEGLRGEGNFCWCRLAYWELSRRVGRQFPVSSRSVDVFWSIPQGTGLSLAALAHNSATPPPESVMRNRIKIGRGLTLSNEGDGVWAYNRSDSPMFVNSPALDDPNSSRFIVYRVPSGYCLNVYRKNGGGCVVSEDEQPSSLGLPLLQFENHSQTTNANNPTADSSSECLQNAATTCSSKGGPVDPYYIRISFVKGWGPRYSRQEVTSCPTWLEVFLAPCR